MSEEEITSVFLLEDLIKEYNHQVISPSFSLRNKKAPLSLRPLEVKSPPIRSSPRKEQDYPIIRPMTKEEINAMQRGDLYGSDWALLTSILKDQGSPKGLIANVPTIVQGVTLLEIIKELGLKGQVYHKTVGDKTYVILKGLAKERNILTGTRYLNTNPQMTQFGLSKVTVGAAFKSGFKTSIWIYGAIKAVEAVQMLLEDGELHTSFFSQIGTDIPKIAITSIVAAAAAGTVAVAGVPVAVGVGIVLVVGFATGVALEYLDQKNGWSQKFNDAVNKAWSDLKTYLSTSTSQPTFNDWDPWHGLVFRGPFGRTQVELQKARGNYLVYTA